MTREEAANILWWASKRHYPGDQMDVTAEDIEAFNIAIAALRGPQPDPITGLVPCGCGGRAAVYNPVGLTDVFVIKCEKCRVGITLAMDLPKAIKEWNTAMSGGKDNG